MLLLQNGIYSAWFTNTGNLVVFSNATSVFQTLTSGVRYLNVQYDGNLTMATTTRQVWFTDTYGHPEARLVLGNNGALAIVMLNSIKALFNGVVNNTSTGPTAR